MPLSFDEVTSAAEIFWRRLGDLKAERHDIPWYPYGSMANITNISHFPGIGREVFSDIADKKILDIGAADGDIGLFAETLGARVTFVDNPQTNYNDCRGLLELRSALQSRTGFKFVDLDYNVAPLAYDADLAIFLGILYHLRNPLLVLDTLAHSAEYLLLSTVIFLQSDDGLPMADQSFAYLLGSREGNNDPTNYWMLTPASLRLALKRSGWIVLDEVVLGDGVSPHHGDARMFCYCRRNPAWRDLRVHHDF